MLDADEEFEGCEIFLQMNSRPYVMWFERNSIYDNYNHIKHENDLVTSWSHECHELQARRTLLLPMANKSSSNIYPYWTMGKKSDTIEGKIYELTSA